MLPVLHRELGDTIYLIPQRTASLAHVLHAGEAAPAAPSGVPGNGVPGNLEVTRYVEAIEDPGRAEAQCEWLSSGKARIRTRLASGDAVGVQVAYFRGWKALVRGEPRPVTADGIGFVLIRPECEGDCEIALQWTGPSDLYVAALVSLVALGLTGWLLARRDLV
jgi:hypothetical protein